MKSIEWMRGGVAGVLFLLLAAVAQAIPGTLTVSGRLSGPGVENLFQLDDYSTTVSVTRPAQVAFYASETSSQTLATDQPQAWILLGDFTISFAPPLELTGLEDLWCAVWIDVDEDGLTDADKFNRRFQIGSVPFALSTKPLELFSVHGGYQNFVGTSVSKIRFAPFFTPTAGVHFNRIMLHLRATQVPSSFCAGIYDEDGNLIVDTSTISFTDATYSGLLEVEVPETVLTPSTLFLTAFTFENYMEWAFCCTTLSEYLVDITPPQALDKLPLSVDLTQAEIGIKQNSIAMRLSYVDDSVSVSKNKIRVKGEYTKGRVRYIPCPPSAEEDFVYFDDK